MKFKTLKNIVASLILMLVIISSAMASSHREAPLIADDPLADNVDVYAFRSPDNPEMITLIATYVPLQLPHGGPNYYSFGENIRYEIHVDNNADVHGDEIIYRFTFTQVNEDPSTFFNIRLGVQNLKTTYTLERSMDGGNTFVTVISDGVVPPNNIGERSITGDAGLGTTYDALFNGAITTSSTGETVFAGPSDDPFFVDLGGIFDLGDAQRQNGTPVDGLKCMNVSTIAIQVPISTLLKTGAPATPTNILDPDYVIGVWASASRPAMRTLSTDGDPEYSGDWVQVSRLGMPLTNEAVIPIGQKDFWNAISPYDEINETTLDEYFYNPELALYMDDSQFGGAVPAMADLRIQTASLGAFDFRNGADGVSALAGGDLTGTAFENFGSLLLIPGKPRSVDLWPIFHTGVPNAIPYQLATGKQNGPVSAGKPFIHNFLPNGGDMLRLNMATPVTQRDDENFSSLGLVGAAVLGLTAAPYNTSAELEFIPNMDGFPNGRRLEDDVTRIELQAVSGVVLAAIGLWYDDYDPNSSPSPVTDDLVGVLSYTTGIEANDRDFTGSFPYVAQPNSGTGECSGEIFVPREVANPSEATYKLFASSNTQNSIGVFGIADDLSTTLTSFMGAAGDADGIHYDKDADVLYQLNRTDNVINAYSNVIASLSAGTTPPMTATSSSDFTNGREIAVSNGKIIVAQDAAGSNGDVNRFVIYDASPTSITLDKIYESSINLWGIHLEGTTLFAIEDNSSNLAVYRNFFSNPAGPIAADQSIVIDGIIRTHGLTYESEGDIMVLTDVASGAVADDGAFTVVAGFTAKASDNVIDASEQIRIEGASTLLGNPVDVAYDADANRIYVAERANGGGRMLTFAYPSAGGDIAPIAQEVYGGISAVNLVNCRTSINDAAYKLFASSNTQALISLFGINLDGSVSQSSFASAAGDADGIYYDNVADVVYHLNRTDNVVNAYSDVVSNLKQGLTPTLSATSSSDFTNGREIAVSGGRLVVAQDAAGSNGDVNRFIVYNITPNAITLDKIYDASINLWGIHLDGNTMFAIEDNSSNLAVFNNFFANPAGPITADRSIFVEGIVRTHGLTYDSDNDIMVLTDVGSGGDPADGAFSFVTNFSGKASDDNLSLAEQVRIEGSASLLGNPVDVAFDADAGSIYIAERANGGGRLLTFDIPLQSGDVAPVSNMSYAGISAVFLGNCNNSASIATYTLDECRSFGSDGSNLDFSEFVSSGSSSLDCGSAAADGNLFRVNPTSNGHSCTPGINGTVAMCVGSMNSCNYNPDSEKAVVFDITVTPDGGPISLDGISFWEKAPDMFDWIDGPNGPNNYPTLYGLRVLANGSEIYRLEGIPTSLDWTLETFDFTNNSAFTVSSNTTFTFQLLGYCLVGNGADVDAWDLDQINVLASCADGTSNRINAVAGAMVTDADQKVAGVNVTIDTESVGGYPATMTTDDEGEYAFDGNLGNFDYEVSASKNDDVLNGVTTLDLLLIQKHILGLEQLNSAEKLIAADITNDKKVSASDLSALRRVILGIFDEFPLNESWKFINDNNDLNAQDPWGYEEVLQVYNLGVDQMHEDFTSIKIGDVNESVEFSVTNPVIEDRTSNELNFQFVDREVTIGEKITLDVTAESYDDINGFQFALLGTGVKINNLVGSALEISSDNFAIHAEHELMVSWIDLSSSELEDNSVLFTLEMTATEDGKLSDLFRLDTSMKPEAYYGLSSDIAQVIFTDVRGEEIGQTNEFILLQNEPNPFTNSTTIKFNMPLSQDATLTIYDITGKPVYQIQESFEQGLNSVKISGDRLGALSGVFYYTLKSADFESTRKMILL